jgi:hypothetical protein
MLPCATAPVQVTACPSLARLLVIQPKVRALTTPGKMRPDVISYKELSIEMITSGCKMKER